MGPKKNVIQILNEQHESLSEEETPEDAGTQTEMNQSTESKVLADIKQLVQSVNAATSVSKRTPLEVFRADPMQDIEIWIQDFQSRASACRWDEVTIFNSIPDYLAGPAKDWYRVTVKEPSDPDDPIDTSEKVFKLLKEYFLPEEHDLHLKEQIKCMKQGEETVVNYIFKKKALINRLSEKVSENDAIRFLLDGLNLGVASRVFEKRPQTFNDFVAEARRVETNLNMFPAIAASSETSSKDIRDLRDLLMKSLTMNGTISSNNGYNRKRNNGYETDTESIHNGQLVPVCNACGRSGHLRRTCRFGIRES